MKERIIHTRVDEELYEEILDKAKKHRVSTSNLIRNIVEDGLDIYNDVADIFDEKLRDKLKDRDYPMGVQKIVLTQSQQCDHCGKTLKKGSDAHLEVYRSSRRNTICCSSCAKEK